jgi:hypothetical protein
MSDSILKLQILARAEIVIAQIRAQRTAKRSGYLAVAVVIGLIGLVMVNVAVYLALCASMTPATAALVVALADATIAVIILLAGSRAGPSENEEKMAREIRDLAYTELNKDIEHIKTDITQISNDLGSIRSALASFSSSAAKTITPLLSILGKAIKGK